MGDDQQGGPCFRRLGAQQVEHGVGVDVVEGARGLVGEDDARAMDHRSGDGDPLLLSDGEGVHTGVELVGNAQASEQLAATSRDGKTTPEEMAEGTITITNIGVFGVDTGTPILNPGEVSIVALGSIRKKPWVVDDEIVVRQITTIGATFDHRVVDGDVASRFVQDVASVIEEPALLLD